MNRLVVAAAVALSLVLPRSLSCAPDPDRLLTAIRVALDNVLGGVPAKGVESCAVILFDQSVDPATNKAMFTPAIRPNDVILWWSACFGVPSGRHSVPTFKASGYTQGGDFNKRAVCWALQPVPDGSMRFPCAFDTRPGAPPNGFDWVKSLSTSFNGEMKVGSLG